MSFDDRPANRQPHSYSAGFRGVEGLENAFDMLRIDARPRVAHCYKDSNCLGFPRADQQLSCPRLNRAHCIDRVHYQVQDDLLQLNAIPLDGKRPLRKLGINRDSILCDFGSRQYNYFIDRLIEIKTIASAEALS